MKPVRDSLFLPMPSHRRGLRAAPVVRHGVGDPALASTLGLLVVLALLAMATSGPAARGGEAAGATGANRPPAGTGATVILAPPRVVTLAARVEAPVVVVTKGLGDTVAAGEVVARLESEEFQANRELAAVAVAAAERDLAHLEARRRDGWREKRAQAVIQAARAHLEATERMFQNNNVSQVDLENARRDLAVAEADQALERIRDEREWSRATQRLGEAKARLTLAARDLDACTIRAPFAGRVADLPVAAHEWVRPGAPVIEILDDRVLLARFLLPSAQYGRTRLGQRVRIRMLDAGPGDGRGRFGDPATAAGASAADDGGAPIATAVIARISPRLDPASVTFEVHAELPNPEGRWAAGMRGRVVAILPAATGSAPDGSK